MCIRDVQRHVVAHRLLKTTCYLKWNGKQVDAGKRIKISKKIYVKSAIVRKIKNQKIDLV